MKPSLPGNTGELLLALHGEFYGGPKAHADAFRILPKVVKALEASGAIRKPLRKPLFIPLKAEFFDAFERGEKDTEYRIFGPRWNERTCVEGRPVVLCRGYGKQKRLKGHIAGVSYDHCPESNIPGWLKCYGRGAGSAICINIKLD
jgi:hypothetical protein